MGMHTWGVRNLWEDGRSRDREDEVKSETGRTNGGRGEGKNWLEWCSRVIPQCTVICLSNESCESSMVGV